MAVQYAYSADFCVHRSCVAHSAFSAQFSVGYRQAQYVHYFGHSVGTYHLCVSHILPIQLVAAVYYRLPCTDYYYLKLLHQEETQSVTLVSDFCFLHHKNPVFKPTPRLVELAFSLVESNFGGSTTLEFLVDSKSRTIDCKLLMLIVNSLL